MPRKVSYIDAMNNTCNCSNSLQDSGELKLPYTLF